MAFDAFLKIDGIEGESNDKTHKGEIEISSFSWGVAQHRHRSGTAVAVARARPRSRTSTSRMQMSKASPVLMRACATGKHIPAADAHLPQGRRRRRSSS